MDAARKIKRHKDTRREWKVDQSLRSIFCSFMSSLSDASADFDLWDTICCAKCLLPFLSKAGPTIPFWLTECGHILCNNHLSPNQSCTQCGAHDIQLAPLQKEMEAPMSEWFRPVPSALDAVTYSIKFQQEMMAAQIMSLRLRCQQQRVVIDRLKTENLELKKFNEELRNGTSQSQTHFINAEDDDQGPSEDINSNGKRPWNDSHQFDGGTPISRAISSSRCMLNPAGPERFTFSPQQMSRNGFSDSQGPRPNACDSALETTAKEQLSKQYSYQGSSALQYKPPPLSRAQAAPLAYQRRTQYTQNSRHPETSSAHNVPQSFAATSRPLSRFKPVNTRHTVASNQSINLVNPSNFQGVTDQETKRLASMGPPPTPQHLRPPRGTGTYQSNATDQNISQITTNRFLASSDKHVPTSNNRRTFQPAPQGNPQRPSNTTNAGIRNGAGNGRSIR
ncbi:hypothetical protein F5887DRAFT_305620 [Amanita rubescens]|nr:hypothetical protein F5887DRAFT_305620 [Amanita rubescens]